MRPSDNELADTKVSALHQHGRDGAAAAIEPGLDDRSLRSAVGVGEIEKLGLQGDRLEQLVEIDALGRRYFNRERIAAKGFNLHVVLQELLQHALGIGFGLVDLVNGDDDRSLGRLGVTNRLIVCGMTPSSAATTSTTMSVTFAPRARIAVKAA